MRKTLEPAVRPDLPLEVAIFVSRGLLAPALRRGIPPQSTLPPLPAGALLCDLGADREDR